jgi:tRNA 2-thiouridine synthesizing protein A
MSDELNADVELDTRGLRCPEPVMMLHRQIRKMALDQIVKVLATDPATQRDIPQFCEFLPHQLLASDSSETEFFFWIKKGSR